MQTWLKYFIGISLSIIVILVAGGFILYYNLISSVPNYNGEVILPGLKQTVEIYRDSMAIPYIKAESEEDVMFALGYLHAQERLFQMDVARRAAEGRLSEIFGEETVLFDKMFLTVGMKRIAQRILESANSITKKNLSAYSKGVNAFIKSNPPLSVEFDVLDYEPYDWKPIHSIMIIRMMAWELNIGWWSDITFSRLVSKFGQAKAKEILPDYPENAPTVIPSSLTKEKLLSSSFIDVNKEFRNFMGFTGTHTGSNNWVVNGSKSASGKPIIANDPHLAFQAPGKWYAVVIRSKELNVEGITLAGVPGVIVGKNKNISWVLTNVMADEADFYLEKIDIKKKKYLVDNEWKNLKVIKENIKVKNSVDVQLEVFETHRGPIISDIHPLSKMYNDNKHFSFPISMKWVGAEPSDEYYAFNSINKAKNWSEFKSAVSGFHVPGQNFVYADDKGNIGYLCGARIPVRPSNSVTFVYNGTNTINDWRGFVPFAEMPMLFNPQANFIASANNKTVKSFPYHISNLWEPSSRIERITELLTSKQRHSINDFEKYQTDLISPYARKITKFITDAFEGTKITDKNLNAAVTMFKEWDYSFDAFGQTPAIYAVFFKHLLKNLLEDELGYELFSEFSFVANVPYRSVIKILEENSSSFIDNKKTAKRENRDDIIRISLADALTELETLLGHDLTQWQWGRIHTVEFQHSFSGKNYFLDRLINIGPYGIGGDGTTLFNTEYALVPYNGKVKFFQRNPFSNKLGPSMRFLYDFALPNQFSLILTTGQSGNVFSPHYKDQSDLWVSGKYVTVRTDDESIVRNKSLLRLVAE